MTDPIRNPQSALSSVEGSETRNPTVDLHIEELVLEGFASIDGAEVQAAVQRELTQLFAMQGVPASLRRRGDLGSLEGGEFQVAPGADAQVIGAEIAQAIYGGLVTTQVC